MNSGKNLERIVRIVQEAFKSFPETEIYSNYKITNTGGRKREIDILIVSEVNGYELKIAIECKDYKGKVSVEKVEAFNAKCQRIRGINKKVMISSNGFQKDAVNAANECDIDLFELKDISGEVVLSWIDITNIKQLYTTMQLEPSSIQVIGEDETDTEHMPDLNESLTAYFFNGEAPTPLINLVIEKTNQNKAFIHSYVVTEFISDKDSKLPRVERLPFEMSFQGIYVLGKNGKKFPVSKITSAVIATLNEKDSSISEIRRYESFTSKDNKAEVVSIETGSKKRLDVVNRTETGEISFFSSDEHGQIKKLGLIASYDPEKDEWKSFRNRIIIDENNQ